MPTGNVIHSRTADSTLNPFLAFRADLETSPNDDAPEEFTIESDEATVISMNVEYGDHCAYGLMRLSDGNTKIASKYEQAEDGFITMWFESGDYLKTEIPNQYFVPDAKFVQRPTTAATKTPKAKHRSCTYISNVLH